jgi:hypothetical protein
MEEREEDKYAHHFELKCWLCDSNHGKIIPEAVTQGKVRMICQ